MFNYSQYCTSTSSAFEIPSSGIPYYARFTEMPAPTVPFREDHQVKCEGCGTKHDERDRKGNLIQNCVNCGAPLPIYQEPEEDEEEDDILPEEYWEQLNDKKVKPTTGILSWLKGKIHGED